MSASPPPTDELPAVFRNPDGTVGFPSVVPPQVDFPVASPGKTEEPTGGEVRLSRGILTPGTGGASVEAEANGDEDAPTLKLKASEEDSQTQRGEEGQGLSPVRTGQADGPEANRTSAMPSRIQSARQISELEGPVREQPHVQGLASNQSLPRESEEGDEEEKWPRRWIPGQKGPVKDVESLKSATNRQKTKYGKFALGNGTLSMNEKVSKDDGRLDISVSEKTKSGYLAKALGVSFMKRLGHAPEGSAEEKGEYEKRAAARGKLRRRSSDTNLITKERKVRMNIVIMVIGSRGDIQPFLKIGKILKEEYGHRVRIATHPAFRDFVEHDTDLEFFSVGGDPAELMAFMVKNPGMIPSLATLKTGEIGKRRDAMAQMFQGFWRACINTTDDEHDVHNLKVMGGREPFIADAIIANPPSFAHIHCAERLGIPLHLMFTFPYTPTQAFPHPLANIKRTNVDPGYANFMSYMLVELMTWQGLGDLVNDFRVKTLGLEPVSTLWAPGQLYRLRVPYTYLWSPGLVPKPKDWGPEIDIAGFVFLDLASSFTPPDSLVKFLEAGPPPVYIGFGSIVVDDPNKFTKMIYEAVEMAGVRALVSKGWGGFGGDDSPDNVYMLGNTPHDWLFPKVQAVVHHGGAGTTAIGLKCGKPTLVVPFFGDQFFWGNMIGKAGAGSMPIPYKQLTAANLAEGIKKLLEPETQEHASLFAKRIEREGDGAQNAVMAFHRCLSVRGEQSMRCSILPDQLAMWALKTTNVRLSALAADILVAKRKVQWRQLRLLRHVEWNDFEGPGEPLTGGATAIAGNLTSVATGVGGIPFKLATSARRRRKDEEKKEERKELMVRVKAEGKRVRSGSGQNGVTEKPKEEQANGRPQQQEAKDPNKGIARKDMLPGDQAPNEMARKPITQEGEQVQGGKAEAPENAGTQDEDATDADSILTATDGHDTAEEIVEDIAHGLCKSGGALIKSKPSPIPITFQ
jgi:UDP:flavonoid glycosyltransferase YjiC (YdhE family)